MRCESNQSTVSSAGMDILNLIEKYGNRLTFYGNIDAPSSLMMIPVSTLPISVFPMFDTNNEYCHCLLGYFVEEMIVTYTKSIELCIVSFQSFDIRSEERILTQHGIDIVNDFGIDPLTLRFTNLFLKSFCLGNFAFHSTILNRLLLMSVSALLYAFRSFSLFRISSISLPVIMMKSTTLIVIHGR